MEKCLKRLVKEIKVFKVEGTFRSLWAAEAYLSQNGYSYGSTTRGNLPVAIQKGEYDLPQKWHNFGKYDKFNIDGVMTSNDWREGEVKVTLYN